MLGLILYFILFCFGIVSSRLYMKFITLSFVPIIVSYVLFPLFMDSPNGTNSTFSSIENALYYSAYFISGFLWIVALIFFVYEEIILRMKVHE